MQRFLPALLIFLVGCIASTSNTKIEFTPLIEAKFKAADSLPGLTSEPQISLQVKGYAPYIDKTGKEVLNLDYLDAGLFCFKAYVPNLDL
jgi:hypothetical protein